LTNMSMEDLEPLSPVEAAKLVVAQRAGSDLSHLAEPAPAASDEAPESPTYTGKEGVERSQGFEPMRMARPIDKDPAPVEQRSAPPPEQSPWPQEINYLQQAGPKAGQKMDDHLTVSAEQAAADLQNFRDQKALFETGADVLAIQQAVDELRKPDAPVQQPEVSQTTPEDSVAKALSDPAVLNAVQTEVQKHYAAAEQARVNYEAGLAQNAAAAAYSLIASFPELQGISPAQIPTAIQVVAKQNPQRGEQMIRHIEQVRGLVEQHQKTQAANYVAQQQEARRQFDVAAKNADADFDNYVRSQVGDQQYREIQEEARSMFHDYGIPEQQLAWLWQNDSAFRSLPAQKLIMDAARWRLSQRGIKQKAARPQVPQVMRPGSPAERGNERDYELDRLNQKLNTSHSVRDATNLLIERRKGRR
jgi:hypothetical protein